MSFSNSGALGVWDLRDIVSQMSCFKYVIQLHLSTLLITGWHCVKRPRHKGSQLRWYGGVNGRATSNTLATRI